MRSTRKRNKEIEKDEEEERMRREHKREDVNRNVNPFLESNSNNKRETMHT
jgi:hypothetical protein